MSAPLAPRRAGILPRYLPDPVALAARAPARQCAQARAVQQTWRNVDVRA